MGAALAMILIETSPVHGENCLENFAGKLVACSADDVRIATADNVRNIYGTPLNQCTRGQSFSLVADFHVQTTARSRYDIGLFFAIDGDNNGDGAASGVCSANIIRDRHLDPAYPHAVELGAVVAADLDGDACRDLTSAFGWRNIGGKIVTIRIDGALCHDSDGDGKMNLPHCISWATSADHQCASTKNAAPASSAHCGCDNHFNLPIVVAPPAGNVVEKEPPPTLTRRAHESVLLSERAAPPHTDP